MKASPARVVVEGSGPFPIDMLRYDGAYPAREEDAARIHSSFDRFARERQKVTIVIPDGRPTEGRWDSFGWRVVSVERI
jgi:hypothetical protein